MFGPPFDTWDYLIVSGSGFVTYSFTGSYIATIGVVGGLIFYSMTTGGLFSEGQHLHKRLLGF